MRDPNREQIFFFNKENCFFLNRILTDEDDDDDDGGGGGDDAKEPPRPFDFFLKFGSCIPCDDDVVNQVCPASRESQRCASSGRTWNATRFPSRKRVEIDRDRILPEDSSTNNETFILFF